MKKLNN